MIALHQTTATLPGRPSFATTLLTQLNEWLERRRQRRALLSLTPDLLKDIGLDPADAWQEGTKPFWRA